ncbi:MAG: hypothetical protein QM765_21690 [Myxococcales bacterium]
MKRLASIALKVVILGIPMVIAACYGVAARYSRRGNVQDVDTHSALQDIKVSCVDKSGTVTDYGNSDSNGNWSVYYDEPCDHLEAEDTMSPARYQKATVTFPSADGSTISLTKVK